MLCVQFVVIYGGANLLSRYRTDVYHIYFDWEPSIPLVPSMVWIYASIAPLMLMPMFYLDRDQLSHLARQMALAMLVAGVAFLLFPATIGYEPAPDASAAIQFIRSIDLPYNLVPSLHVALSAIIMLHLYRIFGSRGRLFLSVWFTALVFSVILTHQHHLADVAGAVLLVWLCERMVPRTRFE